MPSIQQVLSTQVSVAVTQLFGDAFGGVDPLIRPSTVADFQSNVAFGLAKRVGQPPLEVATAIVGALVGNETYESVEVSGPGFINFTFSGQWLARQLSDAAPTNHFGIDLATKPETIVIDYSAPNVAKEMHVGHLRSTVIGDALSRMFRAQGHQVVAQNHLGDWGTPFGMLIEHMLDVGQEAAAKQLKSGQLNEFYQQARAKFDSERNFADRARKRVVLLQAADAESIQLWQGLVADSKRYFMRVYGMLNVLLTGDDFAPESSYNDDLPEISRELLATGIAEVSDGAVCVFLPDFHGRDGGPVPLIVQKSDGGFGYAATDLACVRRRVDTLKADRILYVVGAPQDLHFKMVFATARKAGWLPESRQAIHVKFGSVLDANHKMLRTRSGSAAKLTDLLSESVERAAAIIAERSELLVEHRSQVAEAIGIGAIKYADLSTSRERDYVFDWDRMLSFEGDTGPYLQYAFARINSVLRKADRSLDAVLKYDIDTLEASQEKALALQLLSFSDALSQTTATYEPHKFCSYLYALAGAFTKFYDACPVLKAETAAVTDRRLLLCALTAGALEYGLGLLGISAPQEM